ncbi:hypothetical protein N7508_007496 [Penicillium antarcticum]|uniref:uncharacterized protein n=1 Tax=Penicillium antarcticum TaxID=416450 RepID=UPI0023940C30|nr:uncharacterized protein N7508_007496 [Penicillium antarcticum]KAJ5300253.1 hypothetical protein N7508_007496 [Penicillium antarcticum]
MRLSWLASRLMHRDRTHLLVFSSNITKAVSIISPTETPSLNSGNHDATPVVNSGSLEGFIRYIGVLASSSESQFASAVLGEITQQREKIQYQDAELKRLQNEILDMKERKRITIEDMYAVNENEKAKQRDSATHIEKLRATVDEKENKITEYSQTLRATQEEIAKLESTCSQELAKVSQSAKDIDTLQTNLKDKDRMIDQMKTAGSKLKSILSSEQKKKEELEAANASMNTELRAVKAYIQRLESFPAQSSDIDEDSV